MRVITAGGCGGRCGAFLAEGRVLPMGFGESGLAIEFAVLFEVWELVAKQMSSSDAVVIFVGWSLFGPQPTLGLGVRLVLLLGCDRFSSSCIVALGYFVTPLVTIKRGIDLVTVLFFHPLALLE